MTYYTLFVPWVPSPFQTDWHPTTEIGPWSTLNRGNFKTVADAIVWARDKLGGTPYTIVACDDGKEEG